MKTAIVLMLLSALPWLIACGLSNHDRCLSYGAQPGSEMYVMCRMKMDEIDQQAANAAAAAYLSTLPKTVYVYP